MAPKSGFGFVGGEGRVAIEWCPKCELSSTDSSPKQETLSSGGFDRLDGYKILGENLGLFRDGRYVGESRVAIIKVCQTAEFQRAIFTDVAPALLRATVLWDMIREGPCGPSVYWLIQGFAHPGIPAVAQHVEAFPCPSVVCSGLPGTAQKALTGNSMHLSAIGTWTLYNLTAISARSLLRP